MTEGFDASCDRVFSGFSVACAGLVLDVHLLMFFFTNLRSKVKNTES